MPATASPTLWCATPSMTSSPPPAGSALHRRVAEAIETVHAADSTTTCPPWPTTGPGRRPRRRRRARRSTTPPGPGTGRSPNSPMTRRWPTTAKRSSSSTWRRPAEDDDGASRAPHLASARRSAGRATRPTGETLLEAAAWPGTGRAEALVRAALANSRGVRRACVGAVDDRAGGTLSWRPPSAPVRPDSDRGPGCWPTSAWNWSSPATATRTGRPERRGPGHRPRLGEPTPSSPMSCVPGTYTILAPDTLPERLANTGRAGRGRRRLGDPFIAAMASLLPGSRRHGNRRHGGGRPLPGRLRSAAPPTSDNLSCSGSPILHGPAANSWRADTTSPNAGRHRALQTRPGRRPTDARPSSATPL